jgi:hypothetical protein
MDWYCFRGMVSCCPWRLWSETLSTRPACAPRPRPRSESADRPSAGVWFPTVWSDRIPSSAVIISLTEYAEFSAPLFTSLKEIVQRSNVRVRNVAHIE